MNGPYVIRGTTRPNSQRGLTLVEAAFSAVLVALFLAGIYYLNTQAIRTTRKSRETSMVSQTVQSRIEQLRVDNGWNATNIVSPTWLASTNFLGAESPAAQLIESYVETCILNPCVRSNTNLLVDTNSSITVTRTKSGGTASVSSTSANLTNFTATNASTVLIRMRMGWAPATGGTTNFYETSTVIARGLR